MPLLHHTSPRPPVSIGALCSYPEISVVIVSYNCQDLLCPCLESLAKGVNSLPVETIVVDNNSSDGTATLIRERFPECRLISNSDNLGFARACNQGIRTSTGRYLLLLNPDTIIGRDAVQKTWMYMESNERLAAATCRVVRPDGQLDPSCKREFPSPWDAFSRMFGLSRLFPRSRIFARYDAHYLDEHRRQKVPLIDGCYMMIRRSSLESIGLFDERFFMYAEEMDWCRRAQAKGWDIGYDPSGTIVHVKGEITRHSTFRMLYHFHQSMVLYYWKYNRWWNPICYFVSIGILLRYIALTTCNLFRKERRVSG